MVLIGVAAAGSVALLIGALALWPRNERASLNTDRFVPRELLLPDSRLMIPPVEDQLVAPDIRLRVDPAHPLDRDIVESQRMDIVDAIQDELSPRVEERIEELIFDE
jgi:hypothetical protein